MYRLPPVYIENLATRVWMRMGAELPAQVLGQTISAPVLDTQNISATSHYTID